MPLDHELSETDLQRIYAALASEVQRHFRITAAGGVFRSAGLLPVGDQQYWAPLMAGVDAQFRRFSRDEKLRTVRILAQQMMEGRNEAVRESVAKLLREHGFHYLNGTFVPIDFFDERETQFLPPSSLSEISKAMSRLVQGDPGGALTSACGAVETAAADVYRAHPLRDFSREDSFQKKVVIAIEENGKLAELETQLVRLGWCREQAEILCKNLKGVLNQAAYVMQTLRSKMGDVHGKQPAIESVVFEALKLASVLVALMK